MPHLSEAFVSIQLDFLGMIRSARAHGNYDPILDVDQAVGKTVFQLTTDPDPLIETIWRVSASGEPCTIAFNISYAGRTESRIARVYPIPGSPWVTANIHRRYTY